MLLNFMLICHFWHSIIRRAPQAGGRLRLRSPFWVSAWPQTIAAICFDRALETNKTFGTNQLKSHVSFH